MRRNYIARFFLNQSRAEDVSDITVSYFTSFTKIVPHFGTLKARGGSTSSNQRKLLSNGIRIALV
jgi:hypothetical protein